MSPDLKRAIAWGAGLAIGLFLVDTVFGLARRL